MMARHIIKHRLTDPTDMQSFADEGYRFNKKMSTDTDWVFLRKPQQRDRRAGRYCQI